MKTALGDRYPACATSSRIHAKTWSTVSAVNRWRKLKLTVEKCGVSSWSV